MPTLARTTLPSPGCPDPLPSIPAPYTASAATRSA
jgi:hypothetical protein